MKQRGMLFVTTSLRLTQRKLLEAHCTCHNRVEVVVKTLTDDGVVSFDMA